MRVQIKGSKLDAKDMEAMSKMDSANPNDLKQYDAVGAVPPSPRLLGAS